MSAPTAPPIPEGITIDVLPAKSGLEFQLARGDRLFRVRPVLYPWWRRLQLLKRVGPWSRWLPLPAAGELTVLVWDELWEQGVRA